MLETDPRVFTDPEVEAILLPPYQIPDLPVHRFINTHLKKLNPLSIVHFGGSLRDAFSGVEPEDYDTVIHLPFSQLSNDGTVSRDRLLSHMETTLDVPVWFSEDTDKYKEFFSDNDEMPVIMGGKFANIIRCDIVISGHALSASEIAMRGNTTINCFAMNEDEEIYAHPQALTDLANRVYQPRVKDEWSFNRSTERFKYLNYRYRRETGQGFSRSFSPS